MKKLPYYKISGTHKEIGEFLGTTFRQKIQNSITERKQTISDYSSYLPKSQKCLDVTKKYFPQLIIETESISKAADVSLIDFFFMNNREVYDSAEQIDQQNSVNLDHCTVVAGFNNDKLVIGHNEDWSLDQIDSFYILEATIGNTTFIGMNYMTVIPGLSASMNNYGLVQCINDIYQTNKTGVPKNYIARAVLETKSLDEAEYIIRNTPKASGFNHVLAQNDEIRNFEIAGDIIGAQTVIKKPYAHTNHYLTPELQFLEKFHTKSSEIRYKRASKLLRKNMTMNNIKTILSDTQNYEYPICREGETIGSAIFSPSQLKAEFCYGHPCAGKYIKYELN